MKGEVLSAMLSEGCNVKPRTLWTGDNLEVLRGINTACIDLIYLDPPFNTKKRHTAPTDSQAGGAAFNDSWSLANTDPEWDLSICANYPALSKLIDATATIRGEADRAYLTFLCIRLIELHRVLKPTGSIYLHCDHNMSHVLKLAMDAIFGKQHFCNEIIWCYSLSARGGKAIAKQFPRNHDVIFFYRKSSTWHYEKQLEQCPISQQAAAKKGFKKDLNQRWFKTAPRGHYTNASIDALKKQDRVHETKTGNLRIKYFMEEMAGKVMETRVIGDTWIDIPDAMHTPDMEGQKYPTQKPLALLERIIRSSSKPGDMVLDPFCGSGTTCIAAEKLGRHWVGVDISEQSAALLTHRLSRLAAPASGQPTSLRHCVKPPLRSDAHASTPPSH